MYIATWNDDIYLLQQFKGMRHKFSVLLEELRAAETNEYRTTIVAFINCLIAGCDDLEKRSAIRDELLGM